MAFCQNCGEKIRKGAKFCPKCGEAYDKPTTARDSNSQSNYLGKVNKCPNCGEIINSFTTSCPTCGFELRSAQTSSSVQEFAKRLEIIESNRPGKSKLSKITRSVGKAFGVNNEIPTDEQKIALKRNFPIPNTKEDIFEFMILASSNIDTQVLESHSGINAKDYKTKRELSEAWKAKFEQAYQKALIAFGNSDDFIKIQTLYDRKQNETITTRRRVSKKKQRKILFWTIAILLLFIISFIYERL